MQGEPLLLLLLLLDLAAHGGQGGEFRAEGREGTGTLLVLRMRTSSHP